MNGDCCVFEFPRRGADGKHLMRFQSEIFNHYFIMIKDLKNITCVIGI